MTRWAGRLVRYWDRPEILGQVDDEGAWTDGVEGYVTLEDGRTFCCGHLAFVGDPEARHACVRCRVYVDEEEWITNFGICDSCFEENCPCNEGRPDSCPLHRYPDVRLA